MPEEPKASMLNKQETIYSRGGLGFTNCDRRDNQYKQVTNGKGDDRLARQASNLRFRIPVADLKEME